MWSDRRTRKPRARCESLAAAAKRAAEPEEPHQQEGPGRRFWHAARNRPRTRTRDDRRGARKNAARKTWTAGQEHAARAARLAGGARETEERRGELGHCRRRRHWSGRQVPGIEVLDRRGGRYGGAGEFGHQFLRRLRGDGPGDRRHQRHGRMGRTRDRPQNVARPVGIGAARPGRRDLVRSWMPPGAGVMHPVDCGVRDGLVRLVVRMEGDSDALEAVAERIGRGRRGNHEREREDGEKIAGRPQTQSQTAVTIINNILL